MDFSCCLPLLSDGGTGAAQSYPPPKILWPGHARATLQDVKFHLGIPCAVSISAVILTCCPYLLSIPAVILTCTCRSDDGRSAVEATKVASQQEEHDKILRARVEQVSGRDAMDGLCGADGICSAQTGSQGGNSTRPSHCHEIQKWTY